MFKNLKRAKAKMKILIGGGECLITVFPTAVTATGTAAPQNQLHVRFERGSVYFQNPCTKNYLQKNGVILIYLNPQEKMDIARTKAERLVNNPKAHMGLFVRMLDILSLKQKQNITQEEITKLDQEIGNTLEKAGLAEPAGLFEYNSLNCYMKQCKGETLGSAILLACSGMLAQDINLRPTKALRNHRLFETYDQLLPARRGLLPKYLFPYLKNVHLFQRLSVFFVVKMFQDFLKAITLSSFYPLPALASLSSQQKSPPR